MSDANQKFSLVGLKALAESIGENQWFSPLEFIKECDKWEEWESLEAYNMQTKIQYASLAQLEVYEDIIRIDDRRFLLCPYV